MKLMDHSENKITEPTQVEPVTKKQEKSNTKLTSDVCEEKKPEAKTLYKKMLEIQEGNLMGKRQAKKKVDTWYVAY